MLHKICNYCGAHSFGSSNDKWFCINCQKDITNLPYEPVDSTIEPEKLPESVNKVLQNLS